VNPTDWKSRRGSAPGEATPFAEVVPNQDGAGIVDALGDGVAGLEIGQRVWIREAAWQRADGTAQEYVVLPAANVALFRPAPHSNLAPAWASLRSPLTVASPAPNSVLTGSARDPSPDERSWLQEVREPWGMRRFNWLYGRVLR
jgi:NADPH2:quinone reductase